MGFLFRISMRFALIQLPGGATVKSHPMTSHLIGISGDFPMEVAILSPSNDGSDWSRAVT